MYAKLNMPAIIKDIYDDSENMYKAIEELGSYYRYNGNSDALYLQEQIELEEYLASNIRSMHIKICLIMEFYKLDKLYVQYLDDYNSYAKDEIKHYAEVDVFDSPLYGVMNKYIRALSFIENIENNNSIIFNNDNNLVAENTNRNDTKVGMAVTNKLEMGNLINHLKQLKFVDKENEEKFEEMLKKIEKFVNEGSEDESQIKKHFKKVSDFLSSTGQEFIKEELKSKIPNIINLISEFLI